MTTRPIGIAEQEVEQANEAVKLFPNPAEDFTTLALELPAGNYTVELIDLNGRSVKSVIFEATENGAQAFKLDVSSVSNGMYVVGIKEVPSTFARLLIAH